MSSSSRLHRASRNLVLRTLASSQTDTAPVIDLTGDDDEDLSRALQASLQDQGTTFGPSDRAPDPNWAVVPSNVTTLCILRVALVDLAHTGRCGPHNKQFCIAR